MRVQVQFELPRQLRMQSWVELWVQLPLHSCCDSRWQL